MQLQAATSEGYCRVKVSLLGSVLARRIQSFSTDMLSQKNIFSEKSFHPQILVVVYNGYKNISHFASQPDKTNTNTLGSNFSFWRIFVASNCSSTTFPNAPDQIPNSPNTVCGM